MKFYVASSFKNVENVRYISQELKNHGFVQTYDWTVYGRTSELADLERIGSLEKRAVMDSDIVIILLPAGKGSHIEMGMALAAGRKVFLYSPDDAVYDIGLTSTFYHLPEVEIIAGSLERLIRAVCRAAEVIQ